MSLKKFHVYVVLFSLTGLSVVYLYIAGALQESINANIKNAIYSTSIELREQLKNDFAALQQRFKNYEPISLGKLQEVTRYVNTEGDNSDLSVISDVINENIFDGHYEVYIINDRKIVTRSTSSADIGHDYSAYTHFSKELDMLKSGGIAYKITAPMYDENALNMSQYYIVRGDGNAWVMIGFVLPFDEYVNHRVERLNQSFPSLKSLDLYILTYDDIQYINTLREHKKVDELYKKNNLYVNKIMNDLGLKFSNIRTVVESVAERFSLNDIISLPDNDNKQTVVYALTTSSSENDSDDFMLISNMTFDQNYYLADYNELSNMLHLFIFLVFLFMVGGFFLLHVAIIQKISSIVQQMQGHDTIKVEGFLFKELSFFIARYNMFLSNWKEQVRTLNNITLQDELTKCANRRYFNQKMKSQIDLFERYGQDFSLIMFDIDDFKTVNDVYGHSTGDHVLKKMAYDVQEQLRVSDELCRIGGEEFAVILPETNRESALFVAEKIRKRIEHQVYIDDRKVTVSLGVESYSSKFDFNSFYAAVDSFLYKSKTSGKNCINSSESLSS